MKIVFMGTPAFAVASLSALVESGHEVVGVVTAVDTLGGRGRKEVLQSAVKTYAVSKGIPVLQPEKLRDPAFLRALEDLQADLFVVVAFRMLPELVWAMPPKGTFNLHGSLLPKYRGAAPINWAIIRGEKETGVTTFFIQKDIDTGDIILQAKMPIDPNENMGAVHDKMMALGAATVVETVQKIEAGNLHLRKQEDTAATSAPKIFKETCQINFQQPAEKVHNFIRGLSPYPGAWALTQMQEIKVFESALSEDLPQLPVGQWQVFESKRLVVGCEDRSIELFSVQPSGKRRMSAIDFINGNSQDFPFD